MVKVMREILFRAKAINRDSIDGRCRRTEVKAESESRAFERAVKAKIAKANRDRRKGDDR